MGNTTTLPLQRTGACRCLPVLVASKAATRSAGNGGSNDRQALLMLRSLQEDVHK
ncbi:MAG: hypothetical protein NVV60_10050 [Luteimonas sp.]|nr:hypothetical protein [Luteimonas sp.]